MAAYLGNDVASDEEDAKRIEKAKKTAEQRVSKRKHKAATSTASQRARSQVGSLSQGPGKPAHYLLPRPVLYPSPPAPTRPVGPCFHCGEVDHLKLSYPCRNKSYLFDSRLSATDSNVPRVTRCFRRLKQVHHIK